VLAGASGELLVPRGVLVPRGWQFGDFRRS